MGLNKPVNPAHYYDIDLNKMQPIKINKGKISDEIKFNCLNIEISNSKLADQKATIEILEGGKNLAIIVDEDTELTNKVLKNIQDALYDVVQILDIQFTPFGIKNYKTSDLTYQKI